MKLTVTILEALATTVGIVAGLLALILIAHYCFSVMGIYERDWI